MWQSALCTLIQHHADPACFEEEQVPHMVSHTLSELEATPDSPTLHIGAQVMHAEQKNVYAVSTEYQERASLATTQAATILLKSILSYTANLAPLIFAYPGFALIVDLLVCQMQGLARPES